MTCYVSSGTLNLTKPKPKHFHFQWKWHMLSFTCTLNVCVFVHAKTEKNYASEPDVNLL